MNIIVCNDSRGCTPDELGLHLRCGKTVSEPDRSTWREQMNWDVALCELLRDRGDVVNVFDAYADDLITQYASPQAAATELCRMVADLSAEAVLFDLQYFGRFEFGEEMLTWLDKNCVRWTKLRIVVASRYLEHTGVVSQNHLRSKFPYICAFVNRFTTTVRDIIDML